jgi:hypothetical protein
MAPARLTLVCVLVLWSTLALGQTPDWTESFEGNDAAIELSELLAPHYTGIPSVHVERCVAHWFRLNQVHPHRYRRVAGCALTIAAADFPKLIRYLRGTTAHREVSSVKPATPVPNLGEPFAVAEVYFVSPPEAWRHNDPLIYTDAARTHVLIYAHYLVEE